MSIAAIIRGMYDRGEITNSPEDKKRVAAKFGITVQTVHATIKKHVAKYGPVNPPKLVKDKNYRPRPQVVVTDSPEHYDLVKQAVTDRFNECYEMARKRANLDLPKIPIQFNLKGCTAGMFCWNWTTGRFRVNLVIAKENLEDYLKDTVPHEFCHYIVHHKYFSSFYKPKPHGREWKNAMVTIFGLHPSRCHTYNVTNARQRRRKTYTYKCACRTMEIGEIRHRRALSGKRYYCGICHTPIQFVG